MTNPSQHNIKMTTDTFNPHGINIRLVCAPGMLRIGGLVFEATEHTVRESRDPGSHEIVNVIRNRPNGNGFDSM